METPSAPAIETVTIIIPGAPVTKKNHGQILRGKNGKPFLVPSANYSKYEYLCGEHIPAALKDAQLDGRYNVRCLYYMPTRRRVDLTNLLGATDDILTKHGVLQDDNCNIVAAHDGSRVYYDKENPRAEIYITLLPDDTYTNPDPTTHN